MLQLVLRVLLGNNANQRIPINVPSFLIGRSEDCHLRPTSTHVSRRHCELLCDESSVMVRDLDSRNGTFVNGEKVTEPRRLRPGDRLQVANLEFGVEFEPRTRDTTSVATVKAAGSMEATLKSVSRVLRSRHAHHATPSAEFLSQIADDNSMVRQALASLFAHVVVVDVAQCIHDGRLDFHRLLCRLRDEMFASFGLQTDASTFHEQQIVQVLKDEPPALFCFVNVQYLADNDVQRLREFTQSKHRVLFCGPNSYISSRSRPADQDDHWLDDDVESWLMADHEVVDEYSLDDSRFAKDLREDTVVEFGSPAVEKSSAPPARTDARERGDSRDAAADVLRRFFNDRRQAEDKPDQDESSNS